MRFVSKYKEHAITMKPTKSHIVDGVKEIIEGKTIQFVNIGGEGEYITDDPKEIEFLKKCSDFGIVIDIANEPPKREGIKVISSVSGEEKIEIKSPPEPMPESSNKPMPEDDIAKEPSKPLKKRGRPKK